jgi:hypothetical protein
MNSKAKARKRQRERAKNKGDLVAKGSASSTEEDTNTSKTTLSNNDGGTLSSESSSKLELLGKKFLTPQDGSMFQAVLRDKYQGFVHVPTNTSKAVLERLRDANYYQVRYNSFL